MNSEYGLTYCITSDIQTSYGTTMADRVCRGHISSVVPWNGGQKIFRSKDDRYLFLDLLGKLVERFDIAVHAYVLMGNHYHLLLRSCVKNPARV